MKENKKIKINNSFGIKKINLQEFKSKIPEEQIEEIRLILKNAYPETEILNSWIISCAELIHEEKKNDIELPEKLMVRRENEYLVFQFAESKKSLFIIIILFIASFLICGITAALWAYHNINKIDKDIDEDGLPDINIDINKDGKPDINIDTNGDNKPDLNIDYKGNRKAIFNIDTNGDGKADFNFVTKGEKCIINLDLNNDGWPDINIDIDGDGIADLDIDTDGDNVPDTNIDTNGDGICNLNCEKNVQVCSKKLEDKDNTSSSNNTSTSRPTTKPNRPSIPNNNVDIKPSGPTTETGEPPIILTEGSLIITYDNNYEPVTGVLPDDMPEATLIPNRTFTIENTSSYTIKYRLVWKINKNDFQTNNLKYKITSTNGGGTSDYKVMPKNNTTAIAEITIPARSIQKYTLSFRFVGINSEQNIDKGREFNGYMTAEYDEKQ